MSVYPRMLGRELPCSLQDLLPIPLPHCDEATLMTLSDRGQRPSPDPAELYRLGLACLAAQRVGAARKCLKQALRTAKRRAGQNPHPQEPIRLALALACQGMAQHAEAARHLDVLLETPDDLTNPALPHSSPPPSRAQLLCAAGLSLERAGHWREALRRYQALLQAPASPSQPRLFALHRMVAIHLAHGRASAAAEHLRAILNHQPGELSARICLGHLLQAEGRYAEAAWEYEQALCLEPDSWELPVEGDDQPEPESAFVAPSASYDRAIDILERLVASQPQFPDLRMRLGNLYSLRGDDSAARSQYHSALALHPEYLECRIAMARHELRMGRSDAAVENLRAAIAINNQLVEVYVGLALAQRRGGRQNVAVETLNSAARIANNSAVLVAQLELLESDEVIEGHPELSATQLRDEWIEQLIGRHEATLARHPLWNDLRVQQGMLQRLMGKRNEAFFALSRAALADSADPDAWLHLGLILHELDHAEPAWQALTNALTHNRPSAQLLYRLGLIYCGELEFDLTIERLENASPQPVDVLRRIWLAVEKLHMTSTPPSPEPEPRGRHPHSNRCGA